MITIRNSTPEDAIALFPRIREEDVAECVKAHGSNDLMQHLVVASTGPLGSCRSVEVDGVVEAMFGAREVMREDGPAAIVWFIGTAVVDRHPITMCKIGQAFVGSLSYPRLYNYVDAANLHARKWLKWLGFTERVECHVGPEQHKFYYFEKVKPCAAP